MTYDDPYMQHLKDMAMEGDCAGEKIDLVERYNMLQAQRAEQEAIIAEEERRLTPQSISITINTGLLEDLDNIAFNTHVSREDVIVAFLHQSVENCV